ncbi:hypothetical protein DFQ28_010435 [Apophysomyces sp. BC1034]|nr:hypothetical protein DFQ30_010076 [Apophysomyces sp. BC1015]KAG0171255.1 hypothetical protein DFQ29_008921 [Apophysomyces sp. BC1021]KAG0184815.1 hypothetical protein DFQ28_010435 [Apophysomyces sp. BC1034]
MAEAVFAHTVKQLQLQDHFELIDSAGTAGYHVTKADFNRFDYILCMDTSNFQNLKGMAPQGSTAVIKLFGEYDPEGERIIEDPYYGGNDGFEHNFDQVTRASKGFLASLGMI